MTRPIVTALFIVIILPIGNSQGQLLREKILPEEELISANKINATEPEKQLMFNIGGNLNRTLIIDLDGNPMISIDSREADKQNALLLEHDERYHHEFPGHKTIFSEVQNETKCFNDADFANDTNSDGQGIKSNNDNKTNSIGEQQCFVNAFSVHPSLAGNVDSSDENDLTEMIVDKPPKIVRHRRAFFNPSEKSRIWPNGQYAYVFDNKIETKPKELLLRAFKEIGEKVPCIRFVPADRTTQLYIIHTSRNMAQCSSDTVGYMPGVQALVNVGSFCDYDLVMHEVFHVLGAIHTQNRPDRSKFVKVEWDNIDPRMAHNFNKKEGTVGSSDNEYDYKSAMHYPAHSFNVDQNKPVLWH